MINHGWAAFGRAAMFSYLLDGHFDPVLLKQCRFSASEDVTRQNDCRVIDMYLAKSISNGRVESSLRAFLDKYYKGPRVRIARQSYAGYASLIDAISNQDYDQILQALDHCEKNYLERAKDLSYFSFDLGDGAARFNVQEIDYRLAAIIKMLHAKVPKLNRKITSLHQWKFGPLSSAKQRLVTSYLERLESSSAQKTETTSVKRVKKLRGIVIPELERLVRVSPSGIFVALSRGPGLSLWKTDDLSNLFVIDDPEWQIVSCDWKEEANQVVTLERKLLSPESKPRACARIAWRDGSTGSLISDALLNGPFLYQVQELLCSPNVTLLAVRNASGAVNVVDSISGRKLRTWKVGPHTHSLAWSPDSYQLFVGGAHFVTCLALNSSKPVWRARSAQYVVPVTASSDGRYIAFGSGNRIRVVHAKNGKSAMQISTECLAVVRVSFSPAGDRIFVVENQRRNSSSHELFSRTIETSTGATHEGEKVGPNTIGFARETDLQFIDRDSTLIMVSKSS